MQTVFYLLQAMVQEHLEMLKDPYRAWNTLAQMLTTDGMTAEGLQFQLEMCLKSPTISYERKQVYRLGLALLKNTCYYCGCPNPEGMEAERPQCLECATGAYGEQLIASRTLRERLTEGYML